MTSTARRRIFSAVFPVATDKTAPTPTATPLIGAGSFGGSFNSNVSDPAEDSEDSTAEKIKWERAWHTATTFLSLPNVPLTFRESQTRDEKLLRRWIKSCSKDVHSALAYLISEKSVGRRLREGRKEDDLMDWYLQEVARHYAQYQMPILTSLLNTNDSMDPLSEALQLLESMKTVYLRPLRESVCPKAAKGKFIFTKFKQTYYAMVSASIFTTRFLELFKGFFTENSSASLGIRQKRADDSDDAMEIDSMSQIEAATSRTFDIIISADEVGLGGAQAQRIFAGVMSELLTKHVTTTYAREWTSPSTIPERLRTWVRETFAKYIAEVLYNLRGDIDTDGDGEAASMVTQADISNWQQRAISDLGTLRLKELFDVVVEWDDGSRGAIEDLKQYISTTSARAHLVSYFSGVISQRLLHPGASTTQILQIYVCIIRAFAVLDPRGVLLDRLARPIRRYLRDRDDTVKIIVGGLLADPEDENPSPDALVELSLELNKITEISSEDDDGDLDWDDMNWMPNPVDADVEFKKSKSSDVAGTLISLFESKDIFVKEFQNILGERLLKADLEFDREVRVLELLKIRFGDAPLQACEVMLKDIIGSRRTDARVRKDQNLADQMSAKILSRLFWPSLHTETFNLPPSIQSLQERYEKGFEEFKSSRKLTWMNALGQATVELQLEDRTVHEVVQTWQASVIYAFQSQDGTSVMKTAEQLEEELIMDEDLVQNALTFWVGKLVLVNDPPGSDKYTVLETLPPATSADATSSAKDGSATLAAAAAAASAASMAAAPALKSEDDILEEKMAMIWQYVVGMLTNQGQMPLQRIVMMLGFVVPGGFAHGNDELRQFLAKRVDEGKLELVGGNYKIVKGAS